jgi:hypothetical protein
MEVLQALEPTELAATTHIAMMGQRTPLLAPPVLSPEVLELAEDTTTTIMVRGSKRRNGLKSAGISSTFQTAMIVEES